MTDPTTTDVPRFQIFPAIGLARVGDSRVHTYVASEAPLIDFVPSGGYRGLPELSVVGGSASDGGPQPPVSPWESFDPGPDPDLPTLPRLEYRRRIKRMGCRFRIYEFDASGHPCGEIDANGAEITWTVRLVNKKAAGDADWGLQTLAGPLNVGPTPEELTIDSGERSLSGPGVGPVELAGEIMRDTPSERRVKLGDISTDDDGRLIVYGGHGVAQSWESPPRPPDDIRNAGWYDDTSDGIVTATVSIGSETFEATPARVVVGPPDYAHPCLAVVTLFDVAFDRSGGRPTDPPSFTEHIHPILHRTAFLEWTLFAIEARRFGRTPKHGHGFTGNHDMHPDGAFLDPEVFDSLIATSSAPNWQAGQDRRTFYLDMLKDPFGPIVQGAQGEPASMPAIHGLTLTPVQFQHFVDFAADNFVRDWPPDRPPSERPAPRFAEIGVAGRPAAKNRAAMDFAVGGPFLPGVEVGAIAADPATYVTLGLPDPEIDFRVDETVAAGDLTQSLAVPWQTIFNQHGYDGPDGTADNMWPSARPVLVPAKRHGTGDDLMWTRPLTRTDGTTPFEAQQMPSNQDMIDSWSQLGFLAPRTFYVEVARTLSEDSDALM